MKALDKMLADFHARRFYLSTPEKAAYALGFHAGMRRATNRDPVWHGGVSHCGCPLCSFHCDACAEEEMKRPLEGQEALRAGVVGQFGSGASSIKALSVCHQRQTFPKALTPKGERGVH